MTIQVSKSVFGKERVKRYEAAINAFPTARYLELLPLLCFCAKPEIENWDVIDMGSGTGYVANFFEGVAHSILRFDNSLEMLEASGSQNIVVGDMCRASETLGKCKADLITCLASFHHIHLPKIPDTNYKFVEENTRHWTPEAHLNGVASLQLQRDTLHDWCHILKPGGWLILIDIPGYPDPVWEKFWPHRQRYTINTCAYYENFLDQIADWSLETEAAVLPQFFKGLWQEFWQTDEHLKEVRYLLKEKPTMRTLVESYLIPKDKLKKCGPMIPADFFDDIIDQWGMQRHFGYYLRETSTYEALASAGMQEIRTGTFPTPWVFQNKQQAAWFVHELFGLGNRWEQNLIPPRELDEQINWIEKYLGFYQDGYNRTILHWQLSYFIARKPS